MPDPARVRDRALDARVQNYACLINAPRKRWTNAQLWRDEAMQFGGVLFT
jgi:hypothetical protein